MILILQWIITFEWREHLLMLMLASVVVAHLTLRRAHRDQARQLQHIRYITEQERLLHQQHQETQQWLIASYHVLVAEQEEQIRNLTNRLAALNYLSDN